MPATETTAFQPVAPMATGQVGYAAGPVQAGPAPVSAPGYETYGISAYPPPATPKRGRAGMIVLSLATGVLVLATAALGVLFFLEADARADTQAQLDQKTSALSAEQTKTKDLDTQLQTSKETVAKLNQDLTGAKAKTDEVTVARDALAACFQAIETYARSKTSANAKAADEKCAEAAKHY